MYSTIWLLNLHREKNHPTHFYAYKMYMYVCIYDYIMHCNCTSFKLYIILPYLSSITNYKKGCTRLAAASD